MWIYWCLGTYKLFLFTWLGRLCCWQSKLQEVPHYPFIHDKYNHIRIKSNKIYIFFYFRARYLKMDSYNQKSGVQKGKWNLTVEKGYRTLFAVGIKLKAFEQTKEDKVRQLVPEYFYSPQIVLLHPCICKVRAVSLLWKRIKSVNRSTMNQERMNNLSILAMEPDFGK